SCGPWRRLARRAHEPSRPKPRTMFDEQLEEGRSDTLPTVAFSHRDPDPQALWMIDVDEVAHEPDTHRFAVQEGEDPVVVMARIAVDVEAHQLVGVGGGDGRGLVEDGGPGLVGRCGLHRLYLECHVDSGQTNRAATSPSTPRDTGARRLSARQDRATTLG